MFQTKFVKKISEHIWFVKLLFSENRVFYEIMWKKCGKAIRPQMAIKQGACVFYVE
jgi:hypothetical protein